MIFTLKNSEISFIFKHQSTESCSFKNIEKSVQRSWMPSFENGIRLTVKTNCEESYFIRGKNIGFSSANSIHNSRNVFFEKKY